MPQMSPMNWIFISIMFLFIYKNMKMNLNCNFKSANNKKNQLNQKKITVLW